MKLLAGVEHPLTLWGLEAGRARDLSDDLTVEVAHDEVEKFLEVQTLTPAVRELVGGVVFATAPIIPERLQSDLTTDPGGDTADANRCQGGAVTIPHGEWELRGNRRDIVPHRPARQI